MLPTAHNKLQMQWRGPHRVVERVGATDYRVDFDGRIQDLPHEHAEKVSREGGRGAGVSSNTGRDGRRGWCGAWSLTTRVMRDTTGRKGGNEAEVSEQLTQEQKDQVRHLLQEYSDILSDVPGVTSLARHQIVLENPEPIRVKPYPLPYNVRQSVENEVRQMCGVGGGGTISVTIFVTSSLGEEEWW